MPEDATVAEVPERDYVPWKKLLKVLLIAIASMFLLMVLADKIFMPWYVKLGAVETVPNVVGNRSIRPQAARIARFRSQKGRAPPRQSVPRRDCHPATPLWRR